MNQNNGNDTIMMSQFSRRRGERIICIHGSMSGRKGTVVGFGIRAMEEDGNESYWIKFDHLSPKTIERYSNRFLVGEDEEKHWCER